MNSHAATSAGLRSTTSSVLRVRSQWMSALEPRIALSATTAEIAEALDLPSVSVAYAGDPSAVAVESRAFWDAKLLGFPTGDDSDFLMMSSGVASEIDTLENTGSSQGTDLGANGEEGDLASVSFTIDVPDGARLFQFDFMFLSEEYPEYVGSEYNDFFSAMVNGVNIAKDEYGNVVDVNNVNFDGSLSTTGTFFDGRTNTLTANFAVPEGVSSLDIELSVADVGDGIYDSAVLIDNVRFRETQRVFLDFGDTSGFFNYPGWGGFPRWFHSPAFSATDVGLPAEMTSQVVSEIIATVENNFGGLLVDFTTSEPSSGDYSTAWIGGDIDVAGFFKTDSLGIAEQIDIGNKSLDDNVIALTVPYGSFIPGSFSDSQKLARAVQLISHNISHELGHILGLQHISTSDAEYTMEQGMLINPPFCTTEQPLKHSSGTQNSWAVLSSNLGTTDGGSTLFSSSSSLFDSIFDFFNLSLPEGTNLYNVSIGTFSPDGDALPHILHIPALFGGRDTQLRLPVFGTDAQLILVASTVPNGAADVFSTEVASQDSVSPFDLGTDLLDSSGEVIDTFSLVGYDKNGTPSEYTLLSVQQATEAAPPELTVFTESGLPVNEVVDFHADHVLLQLYNPGSAPLSVYTIETEGLDDLVLSAYGEEITSTLTIQPSETIEVQISARVAITGGAITVTTNDESHPTRVFEARLVSAAAPTVTVASGGDLVAAWHSGESAYAVTRGRIGGGLVELNQIAPEASFLGSPTSWSTDDGETMRVAIASEGGLLLFQNSGSGWNASNLTDLTSGDLIGEHITSLILRDGSAVIAGTNAAGDVVLYYQLADGWAFANLSENHLKPQNLSTPSFQGQLQGYVTSWGGMNIAGVDAEGEIQALWWAPGMKLWRATSISERTGCPPVQGRLSVYLTPWSGINIAAVSRDGDLLVNWWVPSFAGKWALSNFSDLFNGPNLMPGSLSSYVTSWNALNLVGLTDSGGLAVYWWVPSSENRGAWYVSHLADSSSYERTASTDADSSRGGDISIVVANHEGKVDRLYWTPTDGWATESFI